MRHIVIPYEKDARRSPYGPSDAVINELRDKARADGVMTPHILDDGTPGGHAQIDIVDLRVLADQMLGEPGGGFKYAVSEALSRIADRCVQVMTRRRSMPCLIGNSPHWAPAHRFRLSCDDGPHAAADRAGPCRRGFGRLIS